MYNSFLSLRTTTWHSLAFCGLIVTHSHSLSRLTHSLSLILILPLHFTIRHSSSFCPYGASTVAHPYSLPSTHSPSLTLTSPPPPHSPSPITLSPHPHHTHPQSPPPPHSLSLTLFSSFHLTHRHSTSCSPSSEPVELLRLSASFSMLESTDSDVNEHARLSASGIMGFQVNEGLESS